MTETRKKRGGRRSLLLFAALNIGIVAFIAVREFGGGNAQALSLSDIRLGALAAAAGCFVVMLASEIAKYAGLLQADGQAHALRTGAGCALLGKYFDNITPAACGGQPFQMYYLKKHGCGAGVSGALPILGFLGLQLSFILLALVQFLFGPDVFAGRLTLKLTAWAGLACYAFLPVCILLFAAVPRPLERLVRGGTALLQRLHLVKDADAAADKAVEALRSYTDSLRLYREKPGLLLAVTALSMLYRVAMLAMPWFVLRAFGASLSFGTCFCQVTYIYAAIAVIPTPGNSGAAEASFYSVFSSLASGTVFWAMLAWRLLCYYSWLLGGAGYYLIKALRRPAEDKAAPSGGTAKPAYFLDTYFPHVDGVVETVHAYAERIPGSLVVCPGGGTCCDDSLPYETLRVPCLPVPGVPYGAPLPGLSVALRRRLRRGGFTVFHAHSPFTLGHFALRMGRRLGVPVVASFHSKYYDDVLSICHSELLARWVTRYIVRFYQQADQVWACSASTAGTLRSYGYRGPIQIMDNGVDIAMPDDPDVRRRRAVAQLCLKQDRPLLLFVGQQVWQKNLRLVLDTCRCLKDRGFAFYMAIAGNGYHQDAIRAYAESIGLDSDVAFLGRIDDRHLLQGLYLASDLLFFPSLYDNAPLVVREAAAMGTPSLLVRGANAAECVRDGQNGFVAENDCERMADRIIEIFSQNLTKPAGSAARQTIPVSWDEIVRRVTAAYEAPARVRPDRPVSWGCAVSGRSVL